MRPTYSNHIPTTFQLLGSDSHWLEHNPIQGLSRTDAFGVFELALPAFHSLLWSMLAGIDFEPLTSESRLPKPQSGQALRQC